VAEQTSIVRSEHQVSRQLLNKGIKSNKPLSYFVMKRAIDILGSLIGCMLLCLVYPFVGLAIRLESKGPVIFRQERVGRNGRIFRVYKFRTMVDNAEELAKKIQKNKKKSKEFIQCDNDPRVTKVGRFLRKYSIDELPQMINVLKGDMSLIGPRPFIVEESRLCGDINEIRLSIRPGLTGYAQVHGRNDLTLEERMEKDIFYVQNMSMLLDLKIFLKTIVVVFKKEGAY